MRLQWSLRARPDRARRGREETLPTSTLNSLLLHDILTIMNKKAYLRDPCGASSLPFWKTNAIQIPDGMLILREDDPRLSEHWPGSVDTPYFKLIHPMKGIETADLPLGVRFICPDDALLSQHIASCYGETGVTEAELAEYRFHPGYAPDLWLALQEEDTGTILASGIAEVDREIGEGVLEWIQVSPTYRRRGFGKLIVQELLLRMIGKADFVTVSGKAEDPSNPRALYERCGFEGAVIWHIIRRV